MAAFHLQHDFEDSCNSYKLYPTNLIRSNTHTYPATLRAHLDRLDEESETLFIDDVSKFEVSIRDLDPPTADSNGIRKIKAHNSAKLAEHLGLTIREDTVNPNKKQVEARRKDPKSRFIYIYSKHNRERLKIFRDDFALIMTYHQVMPAYLDFVAVFGAQDEPRDTRFSGFRVQSTLSNPMRGLTDTSLGRNGAQYQLSYNLKCVTLTDDAYDIRLSQWSIRQAAFHHQFDVVEGNALWIVTKGRTDIDERYKDLTGKDGLPEDKSFGSLAECFRSSLAPHLLFLHWSTEDWRRYVGWLEDVLEYQTSDAIYGNRDEGHAYKQYSSEDIQDLQRWEDYVNKAIMIMEGNMKIITGLRKFYSGLKDDEAFPDVLKRDCSRDILAFLSQLDSMADDFENQISRAKLLVKLSTDRKELVSKHLQTQATKRMEELNVNMEKEAVVMRIITTVTLIYLPATFVSTFFSTDIVKYQTGDGPPGNGVFSKVAMFRWLQVTLPLTVITFVVSALWMKTMEGGNKKDAALPVVKRARLKPQKKAQAQAQAQAQSQLKTGWKILRFARATGPILPVNTPPHNP